MIRTVAQRTPDATALDDFERQRSWSELLDRCHRVANLLRHDMGVQPDEHVAVLMGNRVEYVELLLGALFAGAWVTPVNRHLSSDELRYVIADSGAKLLFSDAEHEAPAREAGAPRLMLAGEELDAALARASDAPPDLDGPAGGPMFYTSGTTGRPKGVKRARLPSLGATLERHAAQGRAIGLDGGGPHLVTGPLHHAAPLMFAVYDLANGAPLVIQSRFEARASLALLAERDIAHTHMVPTLFVRLLRLPEAERAAFRAPRLSLVLHGAAPVAVTVKQRMIDWWGPVLVEYWGGTEGGVNTLVDSAAWLAHPGTVGRALPGFEVFTVDEAGKRLPPGSEGRLLCRSQKLEPVFEYHGDPAKTAAAQPEPGTFSLGDVGRVDAEGWVHLLDRSAHMIISGGVNIYPAEIEGVLQEHPAVADVVVFGIPDEEWGESVKAAVELDPAFGASAELAAQILEHGRAHLARYKVPRSIDFEARLPRHPDGKLHVRRLREPYWKGRERRI